MRFLFIQCTCVIFFFTCFSISGSHAQPVFRPIEIAPEGTAETTVKKLAGDSLASSFLISINKAVPLHKHALHSEHVYVLSGKGEMTLGDKTFFVSAGDFFFIPQNTPHALRVLESPVKIISVQSPHFDGSDRILLGQKN